MAGRSLGRTLTDPLLRENPVTLQILGICSALAVTTSLATSVTMAASLTAVLIVSAGIISLIRRHIPNAIRLIVQIVIVASLVIVIDQFLQAYFFDISQRLSVFVSLITTNCLVLGRTESFSRLNPPLPSMVDALGNGLGYSLVLIVIGACRELFGAGKLFGWQVLPHRRPGRLVHPSRPDASRPERLLPAGRPRLGDPEHCAGTGRETRVRAARSRRGARMSDLASPVPARRLRGEHAADVLSRPLHLSRAVAPARDGGRARRGDDRSPGAHRAPEPDHLPSPSRTWRLELGGAARHRPLLPLAHHLYRRHRWLWCSCWRCCSTGSSRACTRPSACSSRF